MTSLDNAILIDSPSLFSSLKGDEQEAVFQYRMTLPFKVDKAATKADDDDVTVYGPVYVGDDAMLDRHKELVDAEAILNSWDSYEKNPVILYNHRKDYGVIGMMESVEMGEFEAEDGRMIPTVMGRAIIDGGEKDIVRKINKGMLRSFSIGFIAKAAVKECADEDSCYMRFTDIEWIETSVVDIPASPNALFDVSKSLISYTGMMTDKVEGGCGCGEKHIIAVEERDDSYVVEFGKAEMPDEPAPPTDGVELSQSEQIATLAAEIERLKSMVAETIGVDTVKAHVDEEQGMTDTNTTEVAEPIDEELADELVELDAPVEEVQIKTEEVVEEDEEESEDEEVVEEEAVEEDEEEESEEAVEEVAEEELSEEVVEEVAEATEEESVADDVVVENKEVTGEAVLTEVVAGLVGVESSMKELIARLDETESLKALVAEHEATIASLTEEKTVAETEAAIETEVGKRLAERMAEIGITDDSPTAERKSLSNAAKTETKVKSGVTRFDPQPAMTDGMTGLGSWLSDRLGERGA